MAKNGPYQTPGLPNPSLGDFGKVRAPKNWGPAWIKVSLGDSGEVLGGFNRFLGPKLAFPPAGKHLRRGAILKGATNFCGKKNFSQKERPLFKPPQIWGALFGGIFRQGAPDWGASKKCFKHNVGGASKETPGKYSPFSREQGGPTHCGGGF